VVRHLPARVFPAGVHFTHRSGELTTPLDDYS
jgi:hypothetical protein